MGHIHIQFTKRGGKLNYQKKAFEKLYREFIDKIPEGHVAHMLIETGELGLLSQLAILHKNIRTLSRHTGSSFKEIKNEVKEECGFCINGECKSFADMTKEELEDCKETLIQLGEFAGINLR